MTSKIWLENYPIGAPQEINPAAYTSVVALFTESCAKFADKPAITNFGISLTYRELDELSTQFAAYLQKVLHLAKGERVAIMLPNILQYYVAMFGILKAGLVVVNVNPLYTASELSHQLNETEASSIIVFANVAHTLQQALTETKIKHIIVTEISDLFPFLKKIVTNFVVRHIKKMIPDYQLPTCIKFNDALKLGATQTFSPVHLTLEDIACLQYTGGTTGVPKAAILTHGNLIANMEQGFAWVSACGLSEGEETVIMPLPLYHIFAMTVCTLCFLKLGVLGVLVTNPRDISGLVKLLKNTQYSAIVGINTLFNALLHAPEFDQLDFSRLKFVVTGGMPLQKKIADIWYEKTGIKILEGYGLTEASPIVTINTPKGSVFTGSIGLPVPSTDVVFRNEENDLPLGESGELCVKGPQVMKGYWRHDDETQKVFTKDGYLKTGDIGYMDESGLIYLIDRKKDMVLVSGFNVYPAEVEAVLISHPEVREAGVVGVPSEQTGESVKAFVVREMPALTAQALIDYCHQKLTHYKVPKEIVFVDELPKSNVGKVLRRKLREK